MWKSFEFEFDLFLFNQYYWLRLRRRQVFVFDFFSNKPQTNSRFDIRAIYILRIFISIIILYVSTPLNFIFLFSSFHVHVQLYTEQVVSVYLFFINVIIPDNDPAMGSKYTTFWDFPCNLIGFPIHFLFHRGSFMGKFSHKQL